MKRPNLLLIMSDQHAQRITGCYGDGVVGTPHIDALAADGVVFDNAYCPSPVCLPARMSALTARFPHRQNCWTNTDCLASDVPTLAHALGAGGYLPVLVGRMHAIGPDQLHGYVRREVGDHSPNWIGIPRHDLGELARANDPWRESVTKSGAGQSAYQVKDADVTRKAVEAIATFARGRAAGEERPFALTVGYMLPHPPYVAHADDYRRYEGKVGRASIPVPDGDEHPWISWWRENRGIGDVTVDEEIRARTAYYALTHRMDAMVGEILDALDGHDLRRDTLVVYTSDHGDHVGDRGLWWKHTFFDESLKIPLVMCWPEGLPRGGRRGQVVNLTDLTATILDALGAPPLPNADGRSFLDVVRDPRAPWIDETFAEYCTEATPAWTGGIAVRQRMVRQGRYKLVHYDGYRPQLFDLADDPLESRDRAGEGRYGSVVQALTARVLADWDPRRIESFMRARELDKAVIGAWARQTRPASSYLWEMKPEDNFLGWTEGAAPAEHADAL